MGDARIRWLVGLAMVLATLRFAIVPWVQAQGEQRQQLEVLTQRLDRSSSVVASKGAILTAQSKLRAATTAVRKEFPQVSDREHFRLDAQRMLSGIASRGGVKVALFDWILDGDAAKAGLAYGRVNASLEGPLDSLVAVHGQIEGEMPFAVVRQVKLDLRHGGVQGLNSNEATMALVMDLYYRPAAAPAGPTTPGGGP